MRRIYFVIVIIIILAVCSYVYATVVCAGRWNSKDANRYSIDNIIRVQPFVSAGADSVNVDSMQVYIDGGTMDGINSTMAIYRMDPLGQCTVFVASTNNKSLTHANTAAITYHFATTVVLTAGDDYGMCLWGTNEIGADNEVIGATTSGPDTWYYATSYGSWPSNILLLSEQNNSTFSMRYCWEEWSAPPAEGTTRRRRLLTGE